jgi:hypothetical protein
VNYRNLSDDLRDFIEVIAVLIIGFAIFAAAWAHAEPIDAGSDAPFVLDVRHALVTTQDGGVFEVTGGGWLADSVLIDRASEIVATQAELERLKEMPPKASSAALVITNVLTGIIQTIGVGMTTCLVSTGNALCIKR